MVIAVENQLWYLIIKTSIANMLNFEMHFKLQLLAVFSIQWLLNTTFEWHKEFNLMFWVAQQ